MLFFCVASSFVCIDALLLGICVPQKFYEILQSLMKLGSPPKKMVSCLLYNTSLLETTAGCLEITGASVEFVSARHCSAWACRRYRKRLGLEITSLRGFPKKETPHPQKTSSSAYVSTYTGLALRPWQS